jgi:hypothetical protein
MKSNPFMLTRLDPYLFTILLFNIVPVLGVAFYGWSPFEMFWLFWMETLIISLFNTIRVAFSQEHEKGTVVEGVPIRFRFLPAFKFLLLRIFIFLFYSVFIVVFIGFIANEKDPVQMVRTLVFQNLLFNLALLLSICTNAYYISRYFFANGAYQYSKPGDYPGILDSRQLIIHIAVIGGAVGATFLFDKAENTQYASVWVIGIFCLVKCLFEIALYKRNYVETSFEAKY